MGTLFLTILSGVLVFVIGQFVLKLALEPIVGLKEILGELSSLFLREQAKITNANASKHTASELKQISSSIISRKQSILFYRFFAFILRLPSDAAVIESCQFVNLISYYSRRNSSDKTIHNAEIIVKSMREIEAKLNIKITYSDS